MEAEIRALRQDLSTFTQEMRTLLERLHVLVVVGQVRNCAGSDDMLPQASIEEESDDGDSNYLEAIEYPCEQFDNASLSSVDEFQESTDEFTVSLSENESDSVTTNDFLRAAIHQIQSSGDHKLECQIKELDNSNFYHFREQADVRAFEPEDVEVFVQFRKVAVHAQHMETPGGSNVLVQQFYRTYTLPDDVNPQTVTTQFDEDGMLIILAPKRSEMELPNQRYKSKF